MAWVLIGFVVMLGASVLPMMHSQSALRSVTKNEAAAMIGQQYPFCLQITKRGCIFCETLRELELNSNLPVGSAVYEIEFPEELSGEDEQWLAETLPPFEYYPSLFAVNSGEIVGIDVGDLSKFEEKILPAIIEASGGSYEGE